MCRANVLDLPDVVGDELRVVELVVPVGGASVQVVVILVVAEVLEISSWKLEGCPSGHL